MSKSVEGGELEEWNQALDYGFVRPDSGARRLYVPADPVFGLDRLPVVGDRFEYQTITDSDGGPRIARARPEGAGRFDRAMALVLLPASACSIFLAALLVTDLGIALMLTYLVMGLVTWWLYARDWQAERAGGWPISEVTLQIAALLGGLGGAYAAQRAMGQHRSRRFHAVFWLMVLGNQLALVAILLNPQWLSWLPH